MVTAGYARAYADTHIVAAGCSPGYWHQGNFRTNTYPTYNLASADVWMISVTGVATSGVCHSAPRKIERRERRVSARSLLFP